MKETDLFQPIKTFLLEIGCTEVYGEVLNCDVLGINGICDIIVELKTSLTFKVIDQAIDRLSLGHYVFIAIPKRKNPIPRCVIKMLETHRIGLLLIDRDIVNVSIPAKYNRLANKRRHSFQIRKQIKEYNKTQIGGVKSGEGVTEYSIMIENIKHFLQYRKRGNWILIDEILNHCETYYANPKPSLVATLQAKWNQDWCETRTENKKRYFRYVGKR